MQGLCLHTGSRTVTEEMLNEMETPSNTKTHYPIPHSRLLRDVRSQIEGSGLTVVDQVLAATEDHQRFFGLLEVKNGREHDDYRMVVGLRNSHDKSCKAGLCVGNRVFVCDNMAFSSEIVVSRLHMRNILRDLPGLIGKAMGKLTEARHKQDERIESYKATPLAPRDANDLMIRSVKAQIIAPSKIGHLIQEWEEPSHDCFKDRTVWSYFNAVTEVLKDCGGGNALWNLPKRTQNLHGLCDLIVSGAPAQPIDRFEDTENEQIIEELLANRVAA